MSDEPKADANYQQDKVLDDNVGVDVNETNAHGLYLQQDAPSSYDLANDPHRGLRMRHVQLIAISGAIGAGLFVSIGSPLTSAGPLGLIIGICIWSLVIWGGSNCLIEMTTLLPIDGGFITFVGRFLDDCVSKAIAWNFVLSSAALVCFELTAMNVITSYWKVLHPAILISVGLVLIAIIQLYSVRWFGEVEFWMSITKVLMMIGLTLYTFVTMLGGNPQHDRFGFRFWKNPGPLVGATASLKMKGVFDAVIWSCFAVGGPDYISLVAGEVKSPRRIIPKAFNSTIYRILFFYLTGALCVGIVAASDDEALLGAIAAGAPGAAKSPYVISMNRLGIPVLPSLVNALVLISIFSTANAACFTCSRAIYTLALRGGAPPIFKRLNKQGVPYAAVLLVLAFGCLSYLSVGSGSVKVLNWFVSIVGTASLLMWTVNGLTYLRFRAALKAQGLFNTDFLPVKGYLQPLSGWWVLCWSPVLFVTSGYFLMVPGGWDDASFIFNYGAFFVFAAVTGGFKLYEVFGKKQKFRLAIPAKDIDLHSDLAHIEALTAASDAQRASHAKSKGKKVSDFFF